MLAPAFALALMLAPAPARAPAAPPPPPTLVTISVVGSNDLHGRIAVLPALGGYLANLRRARAADGGAVVLVDAGDMFQGTLESNLGEGAAVIRAYNALGYTAAAIGNHEFDFGPAGPAVTAARPGDDARGALKARAREARFPLLAANLRDAATGAPVSWPNVRPSALVAVAGVKVGLVGVTTAATPRTTLAAHLQGLEVSALAPAVSAEAQRLRRAGADAIVVVAHAGGACASFADPDDLSSCRADAEAFELARALPAGLVDVLVAGHTHDRVAHRIAGTAIIEAGSGGRFFGRVDLVIDRAARRVREQRIFPPQPICGDGHAPASAAAAADLCSPAAATYEGAPVRMDPAVAAVVRRDLERPRAVRARRLGPTVVAAPVRGSYGQESALGNLVTDLMRAARPGTDVALMTGGGLRADLPTGPLTYGSLYETYPFDNRFARFTLSGAELTRLFRRNIWRGGGVVSVSGLRVSAACAGRSLEVALAREDGRAVAADERLTVLTSDFLATGGDGLFGGAAATIEDGPPLREALADALARRGGVIDGGDPALLDPSRPRLRLPLPRPVRCGGGGAPEGDD